MPTTDLQRLHQDEYVAALRSGEFEQIASRLFGEEPQQCCVIGVGIRLCESSTTSLLDWLGINPDFWMQLVHLNNGKDSWSPGFGPDHLTFDELADFIKTERDRCNGDLSNWQPAS